MTTHKGYDLSGSNKLTMTTRVCCSYWTIRCFRGCMQGNVLYAVNKFKHLAPMRTKCLKIHRFANAIFAKKNGFICYTQYSKITRMWFASQRRSTNTRNRVTITCTILKQEKADGSQDTGRLLSSKWLSDFPFFNFNKQYTLEQGYTIPP